MKCWLIALIFLIVSYATVSAQKVFYAEKTKGAYNIWRSGIVGKVKNNIIVWKYLLPGKKLELLVYNYGMELKRSVPVKAFSRGLLYKVDVVNRDTCFDVIAQYGINSKFYCNVGRFNENGDLIGPVKTLESSDVQDDPQNNINDIVQSKNGNYIGLIKAFTGLKKDSLLLQYILVDNGLSLIKKKESFIPFDISDNSLSPFYIDNNGSIVFVKSAHSQLQIQNNSVIVYKIAKANDSLLNTVYPTGDNLVQDLKVEVDSISYFITGIYQSFKKNITKRDATEVGLYTIIVNSDLSKNTEDYYYSFQNMPGLNYQTLNGTTIGIKNIISTSDSGYVITCSATSTEKPFPTKHSNEPLFNFSDQSFYRKPDLSTATPIYSNTLGTPTNTVYRGGNKPSGEVSSVTREEKNYSLTNTDDCKNLFLLSVNNKNQHRWSLALANSALSQSSLVNFGNTVSNGNSVHVLFPNDINDSKHMLEEIIVTPSGEAITQPLVSNNFHYLFQTQSGMLIDKHSIVFPCVAKGYLSFARVELD